MNPFDNADEPTAPDWYRPGQRFRNFMWWLRNPLHNLCFGTLRRPVKRPFYVWPIMFNAPDSPYASEMLYPFVLRFRPFALLLPIPLPILLPVAVLLWWLIGWSWWLLPLLIPLRFIGWRSDKPHPLAFDGRYGPGGGAFDLGWKDPT